MHDMPSPKIEARYVEIWVLTQPFERLLREQADQFQQIIDKLGIRSNNPDDISGDEDVSRHKD